MMLSTISPRRSFDFSTRIARPMIAGLLMLTAAAACHAQPATTEKASPAAAVNQDAVTPVRGIQGLWVWRATAIESKQARQELLDFAQKHGYNRLLVQIHRQRTGDRNALLLPGELKDLIAQAAKRNIAVEALDGGPDMAFEENQARTLAQLDVILAFNNSLPEGQRFAGIHYDIEPYIHPQWKKDQASRDKIMLDKLDFFEKARKKIKASSPDLTLACDIPAWYDHRTEPDNHCIVTWNGQKKNLHQHLQDICDYIGVMSYRRHATGRNSVMALVENELNYARSIGKTITPALETIKLNEDAQISFHGLPASDYFNTRSEIEKTLKDDPAFGGVLTHSYRGMKELLEALPDKQ